MKKCSRKFLIGQITAHHPGDCPREWKERGWAHYTGGFVDTGGWNYQLLYESPVAELEQLLAAIQAELQGREQQYQEMMERYGGRAPTLEEWFTDEYEAAILESMGLHRAIQNGEFFLAGGAGAGVQKGNNVAPATLPK